VSIGKTVSLRNTHQYHNRPHLVLVSIFSSGASHASQILTSERADEVVDHSGSSSSDLNKDVKIRIK
jgi:hypothetical protein